MKLAFVLDVNIVVSAMLVQHEGAAPFRAFQAVFDPGFQHYVSAALVGEYEEVLTRPALSIRHGLADPAIVELVELIRTASVEVEPPAASRSAPDPNDQHLWDLLAAEPEVLLVTGDPVLLRSDHFAGRVLAPREFVQRYVS